MIEISIPGHGQLSLEVLVLDYNGTLALDGTTPIEIQKMITTLARQFEIHILTSDTFGTVTQQCKELPVHINLLQTQDHTQEKSDYLKQFAARRVAAIGNGANDQFLLKKAHLGIAVIGSEGCSSATLMAADVIVKDIKDALELFLYPQRLIATLRG